MHRPLAHSLTAPRRVPEDDPIGHLSSPIVTGGAVIALRCKEGIIIATDNMLSYGGLLSKSLNTQSTTELIATKRSPITS